MAVILKDIAQKAGCSIATVSKIINHRDEHISDATRQRVLALVKECGYKPNALSKSLRLRRTNTIGYIAPDLTNPFYAELARGVGSVARKQGYDLILCDSNGDPLRERACVESFTARLVDGFVLTRTLRKGPLAEYLDGILPVVAADRPLDLTAPYLGAVLTDVRAAAREATSHLIRCGCRRVGFISAKEDDPDRYEGYLEALAAHDIDLDPALIWRDSFNTATGERGGRALLDHWADGVVCGNDLIAAGVLGTASAAGVAVPQKLKVIGMDNIPLSQYFSPALTTVDRAAFEMGRAAATMLLDYILSRTPLSVRQLPHQMISRRSV